MKKIFISIVTIAMAIVAFATTKVWIYEKNGNRTSFEYGQLDSITHITPGTIALSVSEKKIPYRGGTFDVDVIASQPWTAAVSNPDMVQISQQSGNGNSTVKVTVNTNRLYEPITANIKFRIADGTVNTLLINIARWQDKISVTPEDITLTPKDNSFLVDVTCNTSWTASCNVEWLILSEYSGSGNGSVNVEVQVNPTLVQDNFATLTFKTIDEKIWWCYVYREGDKVSVSPTTKEIWYEGGTIDMAVTSNTDWTASSSQSWATLATSSGSGNGTIAVTVSENTSLKTDTAVVTLTTALGKTASTSIIRLGIEKCSASDYPQVIIGTQTWMAENYRCSKYDTQSEAYNATWLTNNTIPTLEKIWTYTPYYTDASDKSKWSSDSQEYGVNLTDAQIEKLGYRYNWAAAVGVADGIEQTTAFSGKRQGICPNGWHVPSDAEWKTLQYYIEWTDGKGTYTAGKHLKTTSGWYDEGKPQTYPQGLDTYGFAALPAGYTIGSNVLLVVHATFFWTATQKKGDSDYGYCWQLDYLNDYLNVGYYGKDYGHSVRCLKD